MRLSEILPPGASETIDPDSTCFVLSDCRTQARKNNSLSYRSANRALLLHKEWLQQAINSTSSSDVKFSPSSVVIAYLSDNSIDFFLSVLACTDDTSMATPALLNTRWTAMEMAGALMVKSQEKTLTTAPSAPGKDHLTIILHGSGWEQKARRVAQTCNHKAISLLLPTLTEGFLTPEIPFPMHSAKKEPDDDILVDIDRLATRQRFDADNEDALIVFTSGTSSASGPKGVRLSHKAIYIQALAKLGSPCRYSSKTALLATTVPFFHVGGLSSMLAVWLAGGRLVLPAMQNQIGSGGRFDPKRVLESIQGQSAVANTLVVVPAMLFALQQAVAETGSSTCVYPSVDLILVGGQSASSSTIDFVGRHFPNARMVQTYACTEAASSLTFLSIDTTKGCRGTVEEPAMSSLPMAGDCVGIPPHKHVEIALFHKDDHTATVAAADSIPRIQTPWTVGVIGTRGPHVMNGYWNRGGSNRDTLHHASPNPLNGWLVTSDLGFWDDRGRLYFCGRVNDTIRTGGETVLAAQVERIVLSHAHVKECAVFGLPDDRFGEAVCCAIVSTEQELSLADIRQWCGERGLAGYKRPRRIYHVKELPKNSSGKVLKFRLKQRFDSTKQKLQSKL